MIKKNAHLIKLTLLIIFITLMITSSTFPISYTVQAISINDIVTSINTPPIKMVALTFDDGPHPKRTAELLDILNNYNVKATFFTLATNVERYPDIAKRILNDGHTLGSHGNNHELLTPKKEVEITDLMNNSLSFMETVTEKRPVFIRPPYGMHNDYFDNNVDGVIVLWDIDSNDWKYKDTEQIANHIIENVTTGSIILLHDIYDFSVNAVPIIIEELTKQNYHFVSLEQMYQEYNKEIINGKVYFSGRNIRRQ